MRCLLEFLSWRLAPFGGGYERQRSPSGDAEKPPSQSGAPPMQLGVVGVRKVAAENIMSTFQLLRQCEVVAGEGGGVR